MRMSLSSGPCGSPFSNFIYFMAKIVMHGVEDSDGFEFHEAEFHRNCWRINNYVLSAGFHCVSWITEPTELIIWADLALKAGGFRFITTSSMTSNNIHIKFFLAIQIKLAKSSTSFNSQSVSQSPLIYITNNLQASSPELREIVRYTYN